MNPSIGASAVTAATLGPIIAWLAQQWGAPMPNEVSVGIGALLVPLLHLAYVQISKLAKGE